MPKTLEKLQREINLLRSVIIGVLGKDSEGEYRLDFVRRVLRATKERPRHEFKDANSFLNSLNRSA